MNISLPKEQLEWLEAEVAAGHFSSIDEALSLAVAELKSLHENDLAWAKLDSRIEGLRQQRD